MIKFEFRKIGEYLGTRQLGEQVRHQLMPLIMGDERVELNFSGVVKKAEIACKKSGQTTKNHFSEFTEDVKISS